MRSVLDPSFTVLDVDAVIFGLDETLVDASDLMRASAVAMARRNGLAPSTALGDSRGRLWPSDYRRLFAGIDASSIRQMQDDIESYSSLILQANNRLLGIGNISHVARALPRSRWALCTDCAEPTAEQFLRSAELFPVAKVTREESRDLQFNKSGLIRAFEKLGVEPSKGLLVAASKPALEAARDLGVPAIATGDYRSQTLPRPLALSDVDFGFNSATNKVEITIGSRSGVSQ